MIITIDGVEDPSSPDLVSMAPLQGEVVGSPDADVILIDRSRASQILGDGHADIFIFGQTADDGFRDVDYLRDFEQGQRNVLLSPVT